MGLGTKGGDAGKKIKLKLIAKPWDVKNPLTKADAPYFTTIGEDYKEVWDKITNVTGEVKSVYTSYTDLWNRGDVYGVKFYISDEDETYIIESTISHASKNMVNALLTCFGKRVEIFTYLNKHNFPAVWVRMENGDWSDVVIKDIKEIKFDELHRLAKEQEEKQKAEREAKGNNNDSAGNIDAEDIPF